MRRVLPVFATALFCLLQMAPHPAMADENAGISRGEYLARAGNCVACHTIEGGKPFAGGLKMAVPFLGAIYTTNITPDKETGIGNYSFDDFDNAMRHGVAKEGHHLYPAMPYPSYAKMTEADMRDLYDYFMNEVEPVELANKESEIPWYLSPRWPLAMWNFLFLDDEPYQHKADKSKEWNRGAYLVQGLGHCGACHTERGLFFQEAAVDETGDRFLNGAVLDHWSASSLNGDINAGLGRWSKEDVVDFMKTGKNRFGTSYGTMVEVINNSTQYLSDSDLSAIATYLKSLSPYREKGAKPYDYDPAPADRLLALDFADEGAKIYYQQCSWCHKADGRGQSSFLPAIAGNPAVLDANPDSLVNLHLNGSLRIIYSGTPESYNMPIYRQLLTDRQIAEVLTFIRRSWGNNAPAVSTEAVAEIRAATDPAINDIVVLKMK